MCPQKTDVKSPAELTGFQEAMAFMVDGVAGPFLERVIAGERGYVLLGRNILNRFMVLLDSPKGRLEMSESIP